MTIGKWIRFVSNCIKYVKNCTYTKCKEGLSVQFWGELLDALGGIFLVWTVMIVETEDACVWILETIPLLEVTFKSQL